LALGSDGRWLVTSAAALRALLCVARAAGDPTPASPAAAAPLPVVSTAGASAAGGVVTQMCHSVASDAAQLPASHGNQPPARMANPQECVDP
jgi:hypothetical protein